MDARDPELAIQKIVPTFPKPTGAKWHHFAKVVFSVPSAMCSIRVSFAQEVPGKNGEKPLEQDYGTLSTLVVTENSLQW